MVLALTFGILLFAFMTHVMWWRVKRPQQTTTILLVIFFGILLFSFLFLKLSFHETIRYMLLYSSCALVYIILYSAIEQQSPTLALIKSLHRYGESGCSDAELKENSNVSMGLKKRLALMQQSDWISKQNERWHLTDKGRSIARLFSLAALVFGLQKGG